MRVRTMRLSRDSREREMNHLGVVTATASEITHANDAFLRMIGYSREEMESGLIDWRAMTLPQYTALDERGMDELRQFGACVPFGVPARAEAA